MTLPHMLGGSFGGFLEALLRASLSATFIAALVLLIQLFFGRWLTPAWRYRLWAVMVVRLLLPAVPASPVSLSKLDLTGHLQRVISALQSHHADNRESHESQTASVTQTDSQQPKVTVIYGGPPADLNPLVPAVRPAAPLPHAMSLPAIVLLVWVAGVIAFLAGLVGANIQLSRRLRGAAPVTDAPLLSRFHECCRRAGIRRCPELLITDAVRIPATAGIWRLRILLPPGIFDGLSDQQQRSVLLHELAHVKCHDVLANWALALAQNIHWFNPAIRWAIGRLKVDREMARDAMVLRWIVGDDETVGRDQYARTLLNLTETLCAGPRCLGMAAGLAGVCTPAARLTSGSFGRNSALKRRLQMIRSSGRQVGRSTLLGSLLVLALVSCTLTRAQTPPAPATQRANSPQPPIVGERKIADSDEEMLAGEVRALITLHKYEEALTVVKQIRAENPNSKFVAQVEPALLKNLQREKATEDDAQKRLDRVLPEVTFDAVGFADVIDFMRDVSGANIFVNWKSIEAAGIERNTPITARLRTIRFGKALSIILDATGGGRRKLGYSIDDGVITISTVDDLAKNVQIRVYDIRDLLSVPPDFVPPRLGTPQPAVAPAPTTGPSGKAAEHDLRDHMAKDVVQMIEQTIAADSWKDRGGSVGALRELQGQLIVTQTPENQIAIMHLLQQMRESRGLQCTVECRFVSCDEPVARALLAKWQKVATPTTLPAVGAAQSESAGTVGLLLNEEQVAQFLKAGDDAPKLSDVGAPRLMLFNGQRAYVQISTSHRYISAYGAVTEKGGQTRYDPVQSVVESGVLLDVQATVSAGRDATTVSLHPQVSALLEMKQLPWNGRPAGSDLMIQEPQIRSTELHTTVSIPAGRTLLIGGLEDPRAGDSGPATQPGKPLRSLFLLVRPTVVVASESPLTRPR